MTTKDQELLEGLVTRLRTRSTEQAERGMAEASRATHEAADNLRGVLELLKMNREGALDKLGKAGLHAKVDKLDKLLAQAPRPKTLFGLPVVVDETVPRSEMRFGNVRLRIDERQPDMLDDEQLRVAHDESRSNPEGTKHATTGYPFDGGLRKAPNMHVCPKCGQADGVVFTQDGERLHCVLCKQDFARACKRCHACGMVGRATSDLLDACPECGGCGKVREAKPAGASAEVVERYHRDTVFQRQVKGSVDAVVGWLVQAYPEWSGQSNVRMMQACDALTERLATAMHHPPLCQQCGTVAKQVWHSDGGWQCHGTHRTDPVQSSRIGAVVEVLVPLREAINKVAAGYDKLVDETDEDNKMWMTYRGRAEGLRRAAAMVTNALDSSAGGSEASKAAQACPRDTDGDGNCGQPACPVCGPVHHPQYHKDEGQPHQPHPPHQPQKQAHSGHDTHGTHVRVREALVERVERTVGMGHGAWGCVDPMELIDACMEAAIGMHFSTHPVVQAQQAYEGALDYLCAEDAKALEVVNTTDGSVRARARGVREGLVMANTALQKVRPWLPCVVQRDYAKDSDVGFTRLGAVRYSAGMENDTTPSYLRDEDRPDADHHAMVGNTRPLGFAWWHWLLLAAVLVALVAFGTCTARGEEPVLPAPTYTYHGTIVEVYDGDTMTAMLDLGFDVWVRVRLRIEGIDTPEVRGAGKEAGLAVRDHVRALLLNKEVVVTSHDKGKYGRWLASVLFDYEGMPKDLGSYLLETGRADVYE